MRAFVLTLTIFGALNTFVFALRLFGWVPLTQASEAIQNFESLLILAMMVWGIYLLWS